MTSNSLVHFSLVFLVMLAFVRTISIVLGFFPSVQSDEPPNMLIPQERSVVDTAREIMTGYALGQFLFVQHVSNETLELTLNWICGMTYYETGGGEILPRVLFLAEDETAYKKLNWPNTVYVHGFSRDRIILDLLEANIDVFVTESDSIWLHDPVPDFTNARGDLVTATKYEGTKEISYEFVGYRANPATIEFVEARMAGNDTLRENLEIAWLDASEFPPVNCFEEATDNTHLHKVMRNDWSMGVEEMMNSMKFVGMWFLMNDGTCYVET